MAKPLLGLEDSERGGRVGGERLLAQDGQVAFEGGEQRRLVRGAGRGDQYRVDVAAAIAAAGSV